MIIKAPIKTIAISFTDEEKDTIIDCSRLIWNLTNAMKNHECTEVENFAEDITMTIGEIEDITNALDFLVDICEMS